jgi:hypothetical protein
MHHPRIRLMNTKMSISEFFSVPWFFSLCSEIALNAQISRFLLTVSIVNSLGVEVATNLFCFLQINRNCVAVISTDSLLVNKSLEHSLLTIVLNQIPYRTQ